MAFIPNYTPSAQIPEEYKGWFNLREAIFKQALDDWKYAQPYSKGYVLRCFANLGADERKRQLRIARKLKLKWLLAAEVWEFFHSEHADKLLVDTNLTGAEVWRMYLDGSYNRGGIRDKKYHIAKLPTDRECKLPLPKRFEDHTDYSFADRAFPERKAKEIKRRMKKGAQNDNLTRKNDL